MGRWLFFKKSKRTMLLGLVPGHQFCDIWVTSVVIYITQRDQSCRIFISKIFLWTFPLDSALKVEVNYRASTAWEWRDGSMVQLFSSDRTYACLKSMEKWWIIHKKFWMKWFLKRKGGRVSLKKKNTNQPTSLQ